MGILAANGATLRMILRFLGVTDIQAKTGSPDTRIHLTFTRYGEKHDTSFTVQEVLDGITEVGTQEPTEPPGDYTDIADLPDDG